MPKPEQRAIVAEGIMNWEYHETSRFSPYPHYADSIRLVVHVADYHPDLKDDRSLGQMRDLKAALRELKVSYTINWTEWVANWQVSLSHDKYDDVEVVSKLSEGAALLEAAAKLAKEMKK